MSRPQVYVVPNEGELPEVFEHKAEAIDAHGDEVEDVGFYTDDPPSPVSSLTWTEGAFRAYFLGVPVLDHHAPMRPAEIVDEMLALEEREKPGHGPFEKVATARARLLVTGIELLQAFCVAKARLDEHYGAPYSDATYQGLISRVETVEEAVKATQLGKTMTPWDEPGDYWCVERGERCQVSAPMREGDAFVMVKWFGERSMLATDGSAGVFLGPQGAPAEAEDDEDD